MKVRILFGDSEFCNRYRGTNGIIGRLVMILDRLWLRKVIGRIKSDFRKQGVL